MNIYVYIYIHVYTGIHTYMYTYHHDINMFMCVRKYCIHKYMNK